MGARHYTAAVDVWSVGCIMAELLSRRILFQAHTPMQQVHHMWTPSDWVMWDYWAFLNFEFFVCFWNGYLGTWVIKVLAWLNICLDRSANDAQLIPQLPMSCFVKVRTSRISGAGWPRMSWKRGRIGVWLSLSTFSLQCFHSVGWMTRRASLVCKNLYHLSQKFLYLNK